MILACVASWLSFGNAGSFFVIVDGTTARDAVKGQDAATAPHKVSKNPINCQAT